MRGWPRTIAILAVLGIVLWGGGSFFGVWGHKWMLVVYNESIGNIYINEISVNGQTLLRGSLSPGALRQCSFRLWGDGDYKINVDMESGEKWQGRVGYLDASLSAGADTLTIRADMVVLAEPLKPSRGRVLVAHDTL